MASFKKSAAKVLALLTAVFITAGTLYGCGGKEDKADDKEAVAGRYVEQLIDLGVSIDRVVDAFIDEDGCFVFYSTDLNAEGLDARQVTRWRLDPDGTLESSCPQVLKDMAAQGWSVMDLSEGYDGALLILYMDSTYRLAYSADGIGYEVIDVPGWYDFSRFYTGDGVFRTGDEGQDSPGTESPAIINQAPITNEGPGSPTEGTPVQTEEPKSGTMGVAIGGGYSGSTSFDDTGEMDLYPNGVILLDNSFLVTYFMVGVKEYGFDGTLLREYDGVGNKNTVAAYDGKLAITDLSGGEILFYDLDTGNLLEAVKLEGIGVSNGGSGFGGMVVSLGGNVLISMDADGLVAGDSTGIYRYTDGSWVMIVDGELSTFIMSDRAMAYLVPGHNGDYYAVLGEMGAEVMRYVFDATLSAEPEINLEIFSLHDNSTVRQAIGQFQRQNPNVKVSLRIAMDNESGATLEDVVRALNTELLGGKGPDLIVLDGLPFESYIDKGVLKDITGLVNKLTNSGNLLSNMSKAYARDGKTYGVPSRFSVPIMLGDSSELSGINSLSDLKDRVFELQAGETQYLRAESSDVWYNEGIMMKYYDACATMFMTEDGTIDEAALAAFLSDMLAINDVLKENTPESQAGLFMIAMSSRGGGGAEIIDMGVNDIADGKALVHLQTLVGVLGLTNISRSIGEMDNMSLVSMFNATDYYPSGSVGILAGSKQTELAESFLELLLSQSVQDKYLYDGFPVNKRSLKTMLDEQMEFDNEILDDMGFIELCDKLDSPIFINEIIKSAVQSQVNDLLEGKVTPEQAAKNVVDSTWLYLAE